MTINDYSCPRVHQQSRLKCEFEMISIKFIGQLVNGSGDNNYCDSDKIQGMAPPTTIYGIVCVIRTAENRL